MSRQTNVAGAAVLAGLIAGGGVYAAGHRVSDPALAASAEARAAVTRTHLVVRHGALLHWHPPNVPKLRTPALSSATTPLPAAIPQAAPVPVVAASAPSTHTSPAGSGDDGTETETGGDD